MLSSTSERPEDIIWAQALDDFRSHGAEVLPARPGESVAFAIPAQDLVEVSKAVAEVLRRSYEHAAVLRFPGGRRMLARLSWDLTIAAFRLSIDALPDAEGPGR